LHERLDRCSEAEAAYRKAIEINSKDGLVWLRLGLLLHDRQKRYHEAEAAYRQSAELDPKHACPRTHLVKLVLADLKQPDRAFELAKQSLAAMPDSAPLLNGLAWNFLEFGPLQYLAYAEDWARKAVALEADPGHVYSLACVLAREAKIAEALQFTRKLLEDSKFVGANIDDMVTLFAELVAAECTGEAFTALRDSNSAIALEPLVVALQMHTGKEVHVAPEIAAVAKDVLQRIYSRIEGRKKSMQDTALDENGQEVVK
jgi:tetratricopeptide (TPR) repeat protein